MQDESVHHADLTHLCCTMGTSVESTHTSILLRWVSTKLRKLNPLSQVAGSWPGALLADPGGHVLAVTRACWVSTVCRAELGEVKVDARVWEATSTRLTLWVGLYTRSRLSPFANPDPDLSASSAELDAEHSQKVLEMEQTQQLKLKERQKFFEEAFQQDMEQYLSTGYLRIAERRGKSGSYPEGVHVGCCRRSRAGMRSQGSYYYTRTPKWMRRAIFVLLWFLPLQIVLGFHWR